MKYMLLVYENPGAREAFFADEKLMAEMNAYVDDLARVRRATSAARGSPTRRPRASVRVENGVPAVTDGPFMEAKEYFGGYMIVDCDGIERATEIAGGFPPSPVGWAIEVRPLMNDGGSED